MPAPPCPPAPKRIRIFPYVGFGASLLSPGCVAEDAPVSGVVWSGYVFDGPPGTDAEVVPDATLVANDGDVDIVARQPYPDFPGYLELVLTAGARYRLRVDGPGLQPTVWRATGPDQSSQWITGALFARPAAEVAAGIEVLFGAEAAERLAGGSHAALWGQPWDPEAWRGAVVSVFDGQANRPPVRVLTLVDGGYADAGPDDPVHLVVAADIAPGVAELSVQVDGELTLDRWPLSGGELGALDYFALASE